MKLHIFKTGSGLDFCLVLGLLEALCASGGTVGISWVELIPFGPNVGYFNDGRDGYPIWVAGLSVAKQIYCCAKHNQAISSEGLPYTEIFRFY